MISYSVGVALITNYQYNCRQYVVATVYDLPFLQKDTDLINRTQMFYLENLMECVYRMLVSSEH